jgi:hypothetical protein
MVVDFLQANADIRSLEGPKSMGTVKKVFIYKNKIPFFNVGLIKIRHHPIFMSSIVTNYSIKILDKIIVDFLLLIFS